MWSNSMKSPSQYIEPDPIYPIYRSDILLTRDFVTKLDCITDCDLFTKLNQVSIELLQRVGATCQQRTLTPLDSWSCSVKDLHALWCWTQALFNSVFWTFRGTPMTIVLLVFSSISDTDFPLMKIDYSIQ